MKFNDNTQIVFGNVLGIGFVKEDLEYYLFSRVNYNILENTRDITLINIKTGNRFNRTIETDLINFDIKKIKELFFSDSDSYHFKIYKVYKNYKTIRK